MDKKKEDAIEEFMRPTPPPEPKPKKQKRPEPVVLEKVEDPDEADEIELDEPERRLWLMWFVWTFLLIALAGFAYVSYLVYVANTKEEKVEKAPQAVVTQTQVAELTVVYVDSAEGVNLREQPDATSAKIMLMPADSKLTVLDEQDGWLKVTYSDKTGWCLKELTTTTKPQ